MSMGGGPTGRYGSVAGGSGPEIPEPFEMPEAHEERPDKIPEDLAQRSHEIFQAFDNWNPIDPYRYPAFTRGRDKQEFGSLKAMCLQAIHRKMGLEMEDQKVERHECIKGGLFRPDRHYTEQYYLYVPDSRLNPRTETNLFYDAWYREVVAYERLRGMQFDIDGPQGIFSEEILVNVFGIEMQTELGREFPVAYTLGNSPNYLQDYEKKFGALERERAEVTGVARTRIEEVRPISEAAKQIPAITGINRVSADLSQIKDLTSLRAALEINDDTIDASEIERSTASSKEYLVAQYIINRVYGDGEMPVFEIATDRITIDGETIIVGQTLDSTDIYNHIGKIFFEKSQLDTAVGKSLMLDPNAYSARDRKYYYEKTLGPVIFDDTSFIGLLKERVDDPGHVMIIELLEKNYVEPLQILRSTIINGIADQDEVMDGVRDDFLDTNVPGYGNFKANWKNMPKAAKALGVVALVVFGSYFAIKKFGFWKTMAGGVGGLYLNYLTTGHFSPIRTVEDAFKVAGKHSKEATRAIKDFFETNEDNPVDDPEVVAQMLLNSSTDFRDGELDKYFTNPDGSGSEDDARRFIVQSLATGSEEFEGSTSKVKESVVQGRNSLIKRLGIIGYNTDPASGPVGPVFTTTEENFLDPSGTPLPGFTRLSDPKNASEVLEHADMFPAGDTFSESFKKLRSLSEAANAYDSTTGVKAKIKEIYEGVREWSGYAIEGVVVVTEDLYGGARFLAGKLADGTEKLLVDLGNGTRWAIDQIVDVSGKIIEVPVNGVRTIIEYLNGTISTTGNPEWDNILDNLEDGFLWAKDGIVSLAGKGKEVFSNSFGFTVDLLQSTPAIIGGILADLPASGGKGWDKIKNWIPGLDMSKFVHPADPDVKNAIDALEGLTGDVISRQVQLVEATGSRTSRGPLDNLRDLLQHQWNMHDNATEHGKILKIVEFYWGNTSDINTPNTAAKQAFEADINALNGINRAYPSSEKVSAHPALLAFLTPLLTYSDPYDPTAHAGIYAASEGDLPTTPGGSPRLLNPPVHYGHEVTTGAISGGVKKAITCEAILALAKNPSSTVGDLENLLNKIQFVDPSTLTGRDQVRTQNNSNVIDAIRAEVIK